MQLPTQLIHIEWDGPFPLNKASDFTGNTDYGIYQIYGAHIIYGSDVLLLIGLAERQTFGHRIPQEQWWLDHHDAGCLRVYLGRLAGEVTPSDNVWGSHIIMAERLLIHAHSPAYNAQKEPWQPRQRPSQHSPLQLGLFSATCFQRFPAPVGRASLVVPMPGYHEFNTDDPRQ